MRCGGDGSDGSGNDNASERASTSEYRRAPDLIHRQDARALRAKAWPQSSSLPTRRRIALLTNSANAFGLPPADAADAADAADDAARGARLRAADSGRCWKSPPRSFINSRILETNAFPMPAPYSARKYAGYRSRNIVHMASKSLGKSGARRRQRSSASRMFFTASAVSCLLPWPKSVGSHGRSKDR